MAARHTPKAPKLTKEVEETILRHIRAGAFLKHACEAAGIEDRTLRNWMTWAEAGKKPYMAFAQKVLKARAEDAIRSQSIVTRAQLGHIDGNWKAAAWSLERKHPKQYGQAAMLAAVTVRGGGVAGATTNTGDEGEDGASTTVQFYLPSNGRRPQDDDGEA